MKSQNLDALTVLMLMVRRHEKDYMLRGATKYIDRIDQRISEFEAKIDELGMSDQMKAELMSLWSNYRTGIRALVAADSELQALQQDFDKASERMTREIDGLEADLNTRISQEKSTVLSSLSTTRSLLTIIFAFALIISVVVTLWIIRSITRSLDAVNHQVTELVNGRLDVVSSIRSEDEIGTIMRAVEHMRENLVQVVGSIKRSTLQVNGAVSQVSGGNSELSRRTQEQAAALEQIASSMEEMTATVSQNAENAGRASEIAQHARGQAEHGSEVVTQAISAMEEIDEASSQIEVIIRVIDDIAYQINLLALNAAVEAAQAGEQGRGFAVVANEVRALAGRSATASKEIRELITDSVEKVASGRTLVDQSGELLEQILNSVKQVSDTVAEIAAASREQSEGIMQVNRSITHMDDMTQRNAALVEEVAATAEALGREADDLAGLVTFFKLDVADEIQRESADIIALRSSEHLPRISRTG